MKTRLNRFNVSESIQRAGYESLVNLHQDAEPRAKVVLEGVAIFFSEVRAGFDGDRFNAVRLFRVISEDSAERDSLDESSAFLIEGAQCVPVLPRLPFQVRPTRRSWLRALDEQENVANARLDFECMPSSLTHLSLRVVAHVGRQRGDLEILLQAQRFELQKPRSLR